MKVDISIQSYKKPESLIYALFKLHSVAKNMVDTVWINDDKSGGETLELYYNLKKSNKLSPWKINIRENTKRVGWWVSFVKGITPSYSSFIFRFKRKIWNFYKNKNIYIDQNDIRYQWAINNTDKKYLFIMHDDIFFHKDIISLYLNSINALGSENKKPLIVGDLGQCWRCDYKNKGCKPQKILEGYRPSPKWPNTKTTNKSHSWACRINEWSALLCVTSAKELLEKEKIFFGNYDNNGDISAYWFSRGIYHNYSFHDPLPSEEDRNVFYTHWENNITGHSTWVDQGFGKSIYSAQKFRDLLNKEFNYQI